MEASADEIADRLDPDSLYSNFLHGKKTNLSTASLSQLATLRDETDSPKGRKGFVAYIDLREVDATFGTVMPRRVDGARIRGSRAKFRVGDILFSRIRPYLRRVAYVSDYFESGVCSKEFHVLTPNQGIRPLYLLTMLRTKFCTAQAKGKVTGSSRPRTPLEKLKRVKVPILDDTAQEKIEQVVRHALTILDSGRVEVNIVVSGLSAKLDEILPKKLLANTVEIPPASDGSRIDPEFHAVQKWLSGLNRKRLDTTSLVDVASFSEAMTDPSERPTQLFDYIEIEGVSPRTGQIDHFSQVYGKDAVGRARRPLKAAQVILSTTRPARGSIAIVPEYHDGDVASTGFQLLETREGSPVEYLYCALKTDFCLTQLWGKSTGTGYPEISQDELATVRIPILKGLLSEEEAIKVGQVIATCQTAKVALLELEWQIERRLDDEITDSDLSAICDGMVETLSFGGQRIRLLPRMMAQESERTLYDFFEP